MLRLHLATQGFLRTGIMKVALVDVSKILTDRHREHAYNAQAVLCAASLRARQFAKIRQVGDALVDAGYVSLDEQAKALGLSRSTTWTILRASHKNSGLSAGIINRMLSTPDLPAVVRLKLYEYVEEKSAGLYGDGRIRVRKFAARLSATLDGGRRGDTF